MKKLTAVVVAIMALLMVPASANAKILRFGVKAGANFNKISLTSVSDGLNSLKDKANSSGWEAGVMIDGQVPLIGLGFDLSLMYARMNNNSEIYNNNNMIFEGSKNFLMIPLNIKYKISLPVVGNYLAPYVFTGPNFLLNLDKNTFANIKNKTCQVAWQLGLGLEFFNHVQIGAGYNFGLGKIGNSIFNGLTGINQNTTYTVKNNYWMVTAAYLF